MGVGVGVWSPRYSALIKPQLHRVDLGWVLQIARPPGRWRVGFTSQPGASDRRRDERVWGTSAVPANCMRGPASGQLGAAELGLAPCVCACALLDESRWL